MRRRQAEQKTGTSNVNEETPQMKATDRSRRRGLLAALAASAILIVAALVPATAGAQLSFSDFDVTAVNANGSPATQAGSHPFAFQTDFGIDYTEGGIDPEYGVPLNFISGSLKDLVIDQVPGVVADTTTYPRCTAAEFAEHFGGIFGEEKGCPDEAAVGVVGNAIFWPWLWTGSPVYNMVPPPGALVRFGFRVADAVNVVVDVRIQDSPPYNAVAALSNTSQITHVFGSKFQLWGHPTDPAHDKFRGLCYEQTEEFDPFGGEFDFEFKPSSEACPVAPRDVFMTLPASCLGPQLTAFEANSWEAPGTWISGGSLSHDNAIPPNPQGFTGCGQLNFSPAISSKPSTDSAETGTGLEFRLEFNDEGLKNPDGLAESQVKKTVVTLPEGVTVNPSVGEGLGVCAPADLARETLHSAPGSGCPNSSKVGTVHVDTPLVDEPVEGSVFIAPQDDPATSTPGAENPFDSLVALHIVLRNANLGLLIKIPAKVEPDPLTGQIVTTVEEAPQLPFSSFQFRFREGQRAPLISPPACGTYQTKAVLYPWANPDEPRTVFSDFQITEGVAGGPCPPGGIPPFNPGFEAGSINNNAKAFSPFYMRLLRGDGQQNMTKFSSVLPPGVLGKLAGVGKCPDATIEAAKAKTGKEELAAPSCPANSKIGRTMAGAGVGGALTYVPGSVYMAGPYKGAPLSVVAVTPAVAGPFDGGTVVVREGLDLNPITAEVEVDGEASDPIPHILKGIPLKLRDLRVYVDRPEFTLNPTSCDESSAKATLFGSFLDLFSPADDVPVNLATRYQAANCLNLGFKPRLKLNLRGGTKRGGHPGLKAVLRTRPDDANIGAVTVTLPRSAFLDQAHIRTICTRVQYAAEQCPQGSIYGHAKAITPLLDEPIEGPVFLRSSDNKLPDLVIGLKGLVDVDVSSRIDSKNGGIRNSFEVVPDAPVTEFTLTLQGGKKGLIVNSRDLCERPSRVKARFVGQNGRVANLRPLLKPQCGGKR